MVGQLPTSTKYHWLVVRQLNEFNLFHSTICFSCSLFFNLIHGPVRTRQNAPNALCKPFRFVTTTLETVLNQYILMMKAVLQLLLLLAGRGQKQINHHLTVHPHN